MADTASWAPSRFGRLWTRLPALLRGTIVAFVILTAGQLPPGIFLFAGLTFTPAVPWFLLATLIWLWMFWRYLDGRGYPNGTAEARRRNLRGAPPSQRCLIWSLVAGGFGMVSVLCGALLTGLVANLPASALDAPFDLSPYPWWTILAFFLNLALVAGVVEEAAFRGYMLSIVQRRHGWLVGIASVAVLFYLAHLSHAYATLAFVPFFIAYSVLHGALVFVTRSIVPSVILHFLGDFLILPMQYDVTANPLGTSVGSHVLVIATTGLAAALILWRLARASRHPPRTGAVVFDDG